MTDRKPDTRFGFLVERRLAGVQGGGETEELSGMLERSPEARGEYVASVENHVDLGSALGGEAAQDARDVKEKTAMARVKLNCTCSWTFFISDNAAGYEVLCPACGMTVRIPGRKPGQGVRMTPGEIAAERMRRQALIKTTLAAAALLLLTAGIYAAVPGKEAPPPPVESGLPKPPKPLPPAPALPLITPDLKPPPPPPKPVYTEEQIATYNTEISDNLWLINMWSLVAEIPRILGGGFYEQLQADISHCESKVRDRLERLQKVDRVPLLPSYFATGDRLVQFAGKDLTTVEPVDVALLLCRWAQDWKPDGSVESAVVYRDGKRIEIVFRLPENRRHLVEKLRMPDLLAMVTPSTGCPPPGGMPLPDALVKQFRARARELLPESLRLLAPADKQRIDELLGGKKALPEDFAWFQTRALEGFLAVLEADSREIRARAESLRERMTENPAPDLLILTNGQRLNGKISDAGEGRVRIKFGPGARVLAENEIQQKLPGKGIGGEFAERHEKAKGRVAPLLDLMGWCSEHNLANEKAFVAAQVLLLDATQEKARAALGLRRPVFPSDK